MQGLAVQLYVFSDGDGWPIYRSSDIETRRDSNLDHGGHSRNVSLHCACRSSEYISSFFVNINCICHLNFDALNIQR